MLTSIYSKSLRDRWVSTTASMALVGAFLVLAMAAYGQVGTDVYSQMPEALRSLMGIPDGADAATLAYTVVFGMMGALTLAGLALSMGASSVAGDARDGSIGVLLGNLGGGEGLPDWRPQNYIGFLSIGVFIYSYQQRSITTGASSIVGNLGLIRSLQFPRAVLPASTVIREVLGFGSSFVVMAAVMLLSGEGITWSWLLFPLAFMLATMFAFGGSLVTARLTEAVRDTRNLLPFVFRLLFYVSGILYDITRFTEDYPNWRFLDDMFLLNPFYVYVSLVREVLMSSYSHNNPPLVWLAAVVWAVVAMTGGMYYFVGAEKRYGRG
jgi:ABC-type polysaccharide/polyol phosphate export permease